MTHGITVTPEQVEKIKDALSETYRRRYEQRPGDNDDYLRGFGKALGEVLDLIGAEHERWDPLGAFGYEGGNDA